MPTILFSSHNKPLITNMAENSFKPDINANMTPNTDNDKEWINQDDVKNAAENFIEKLRKFRQHSKTIEDNER